MTPHKLLHTAIIPALAELKHHGIPDTMEARRLLLAIALQESRINHRRQMSSDGTESGPAKSFWQFEQGGGCKGVLTHRQVAPSMRAVCEVFNIEPTSRGLWDAIQYHDVVAAAAARLLVYTLPGKLPTTVGDGWEQYLNAWRPGHPHPASWAANWNLATKIAEED